MQKLKCPNCNRVLGGKATTKKNGKPYFYYYCHDCKIEFRENLINEYFNQFIDELVQYDSVVNQFFLPMIRQKFDEPKEQLQKEIKNQKDKLDRIKNAYLNGAFDVKEYKEEKQIVEKVIIEQPVCTRRSRRCGENRINAWAEPSGSYQSCDSSPSRGTWRVPDGSVRQVLLPLGWNRLSELRLRCRRKVAGHRGW